MEERAMKCMHQLFEQQAEKTPGSIALIFEGETMTYGELESRSNQLAHYLQWQGVCPEVLVGICIRKSFEMVIGVLGILKAGGAYVPIDMETPKELAEYILNDCQAGFVITEKKLAGKFGSYSRHLFISDENLEILDNQNTERPASAVTPENLAYIIYTSGSTGRPKGVLVEHKTAFNVLQSVKEKPGITENDTLIAMGKLSFDISTVEIYSPLMVGGKVLLAGNETVKNAQELRRVIENGVTIIYATPYHYRMLMEAGWKGNKTLKMISTAEALPANNAKIFFDLCHDLWNFYGPTETTVFATGYELQKDDQCITIGYPIKNATVYILDENRQKVENGERGEIYIGGAGVSRGYLNRPDLTAEKFLSDPFSEIPGARMYRSGDIGRIIESGQIEYLGREDDQVKIHGFRIELGEVESIVAQHPRVSQAVVVAWEDTPGNKKLAAYIIEEKQDGAKNISPTKKGADNEQLKEEIRLFCSKKLNPYMVPHIFVILEKFPQNQNGKIDRKALSKPANILEAAPNDISSSRAFNEKILAVIWSELLKIPNVGIHDNFFDLGGDSLLSVQMINQANKMGINITVAQLLIKPTIASLAFLPINGSAISSSSVVAINDKGDKPFLFYFPPSSGDFTIGKALSSSLGLEQPLFSVVPIGGDGLAEPLTSIEAIAKQQIKEIKKVQPEGPYYLMGFSIGGLIAYEIALQLKVSGFEVGLVIMIDSYAPGSHYISPEMSVVSKAKEIINYHSKTLGGMNFQRRALYIQKQANKEWKLRITRPLAQFINKFKP